MSDRATKCVLCISSPIVARFNGRINNMKSLLPVKIDEIIALITLLVGYLLSFHEPFFRDVANVAIIYIFICIVFRKYEYVQRKLKK